MSSPPPASSPTTTATPAAPDVPKFSPLYRQIRRLLEQRLQAGDWKPGEAIPSELELAAHYRVSQGTVRKAVDELAGENLLVRRQGKGTFVATHAEQQVQHRFLHLRPDDGAFRAAARQVLACRRLRAPAEVGAQLGLRGAEPVLYVRRVLSFDGHPVILEDMWLPGGPFRGLTAARMESYPGPTYALFETAFGVRMVRATEKVRAVAADGESGALLAIPPGTPLLSVERLSFTYSDTPMELRRGLYLTDGYHYRNELI